MNLPACSFRLPTTSRSHFYCLSPRVCSGDNIVSPPICKLCTCHADACEPLPRPKIVPVPMPGDSFNTYISCEQLAADTRTLAGSLPSNVTGIAGIPRSGMIPASLLAAMLHVPLYEVHVGDGLRPVDSGLRLANRVDTDGPIVVIDDSVFAGVALERAKSALQDVNRELIFAALYPRPETAHLLDVYVRTVPHPHLFEWNLFNCMQSREFAMDFDGIICRDYPGIDNDDRDYLAFLDNAPPQWLPRRFSVPLIVTARLENYRAQTERWLSRHGVRCKRLVMGPWTSAQERRRQFDAGSYKGRPYAESNCTLFIESDVRQAEAIWRYSRKPVLCPSTGTIFQ